MIRAVNYLWQWYTTGRICTRQIADRVPVTGGTPYPPAYAIQRILASINGVEIDPLTTAVGRPRMTVYIGHFMAQAGLIAAPLCLVAFRSDVTPRIAVGDAVRAEKGIEAGTGEFCVRATPLF